MLEDPNGFEAHLQRYTASIGSTFAYGWRVSSIDNPLANTSFEVRQLMIITSTANEEINTELSGLVARPWPRLPQPS